AATRARITCVLPVPESPVIKKPKLFNGRSGRFGYHDTSDPAGVSPICTLIACLLVSTSDTEGFLFAAGFTSSVGLLLGSSQPWTNIGYLRHAGVPSKQLRRQPSFRSRPGGARGARNSFSCLT